MVSCRAFFLIFYHSLSSNSKFYPHTYPSQQTKSKEHSLLSQQTAFQSLVADLRGDGNNAAIIARTLGMYCTYKSSGDVLYSFIHLICIVRIRDFATLLPDLFCPSYLMLCYAIPFYHPHLSRPIGLIPPYFIPPCSIIYFTMLCNTVLYCTVQCCPILLCPNLSSTILISFPLYGRYISLRGHGEGSQSKQTHSAGTYTVTDGRLRHCYDLHDNILILDALNSTPSLYISALMT